MNLGNLRSHFIALLNRSDITNSLADTFIDQSIARIQRQLRIPSMEKTHTYTISAQTGSLTIPNDFLEPIDLYADDHSLSRITFRDMQDYKDNTYTGSPFSYSRNPHPGQSTSITMHNLQRCLLILMKTFWPR